jgi:hypothetical protein
MEEYFSDIGNIVLFLAGSYLLGALAFVGAVTLTEWNKPKKEYKHLLEEALEPIERNFTDLDTKTKIIRIFIVGIPLRLLVLVFTGV